MTERSIPEATNAVDEDELVSWFDSLSNWGRWGASDQMGTLNLITPQKVVEAAQLVTRGRTVSSAWTIETASYPDQLYGPPHRFMLVTGQGHHDPNPRYAAETMQRGASEYFGLVFHGRSETHIDALSHTFWNAKMYNGYPAEEVSSVAGAAVNSVEAASVGIVTKGVLLDVPRFRGVDWLGPGEGVSARELEQIAASQGVSIGAGDALFLRTGVDAKRQQEGRSALGHAGSPGWSADCLPWFKEHDIAIIGSDATQDVKPFVYRRVPGPIHRIGIVSMGLWLVDNCNLLSLAQSCVEFDTWEFHLSVSALRIEGGTGSPVNPIATF